MKDEEKTKEQLTEEIRELRQRLADLERRGIEYQQGIIRDIAERKRAEEALRDSEEKFRTLFEGSRDAIYSTTREGEFADLNKSALDLFAYTREEFMKLKVQEIYVHPEDRPKFQQEIEKRGFVRDYEVKVRKKDGTEMDCLLTTTLWRSKDGKILGYHGIIRDITERKRAEEELRESEGRYRTLVESASHAGEALLLTQDTDEVETACIFTNPEAERITGYTEDELRHRAWIDIVHPRFREDARDRARRRLGGEIIPGLYEISIVTKGGLEVPIEITSSATKFKGKPAIVGYFRDITERKRAEEERGRLLADLEAKNRELEAFVYTISHDLKAPLVSLNGFSSVLQKQYESQLGEEGKHYLERIQANVAHMEALLTSLLELSRIGRVVGSIEEIDAGPLLRKIRDELAVRIEEVGAEFVVQEPLPTVRADRGRIHQVFVNLIDNAVKFRSAERALRIEVGCRQEGGFYRFHVADNGIGIAPQYHEEIFAPFRKLHPEIEGVGIGLALVKKIVEHHGGRVWVYSEAGRGSTFYFTIPRG